MPSALVWGVLESLFQPREHRERLDRSHPVAPPGRMGEPSVVTRRVWLLSPCRVTWETKSIRVFPDLSRACVPGRFSRVPLCATAWTAAHQAPLSLGFSRQEYWGGLHALLQGIFTTQGWNQRLLNLPRSQAGSLPLAHLGGPSRVSADTKADTKPREVETDGAPRAAAVQRPRVQPGQCLAAGPGGCPGVWGSGGLPPRRPVWPPDRWGAWARTRSRLPEARKLFSSLSLVSFKVEAQGTWFQELNVRLIRGTFSVITWSSYCWGR